MTIKEGQPQSPDRNRLVIPLAQWRTGIINSVLEFGLLPATALSRTQNKCLTSGDGWERDEVYGRYLIPTQRDSSDHLNYFIPPSSFEDALYKGDDSILPVLFEREGDGVLEMEGILDEAQNRRLFRERVTSSFLVVAKCSPDLNKERENLRYKQDYAYPIPAVFPSWINYLIFPQPILDNVDEVGINGLAIPIKVATRRIRREIGLWNMNVVDYETPLNEIANELDGEPIWIHGVRLPTEGDLLKIA